jgi:hypothetical protein
MASSGMLRHVGLVSFPETSVLTRTTWRNIQEDAILHSHRRENLKSYNVVLSWRILFTLMLELLRKALTKPTEYHTSYENIPIFKSLQINNIRPCSARTKAVKASTLKEVKLI